MSFTQFSISFIVGFVIFLIAFFIGDTSLFPALFCGFVGFLGNVYAVKRQQQKNRSRP
ncbi:TPA: hypothetical protein ACUI23_000646 [Staphylococcus pseudintermedius]